MTLIIKKIMNFAYYTCWILRALYVWFQHYGKHCYLHRIYKRHLIGETLLVSMVTMLEESTNVYDDSGSFSCYNISKRMKRVIQLDGGYLKYDWCPISWVLFTLFNTLKNKIEWKMSGRMKREGRCKCPTQKEQKKNWNYPYTLLTMCQTLAEHKYYFI